MNTKHIILSLSTLVLLIFTSCNNQAQTNNQNNEDLVQVSKIEVLDFHSTHRCMTCNAIEANTKYTLDTYFAHEVENGTITLQIINVDDKENEKLAEKFEAAGTALILNVIKNGKETKIDLTEFAFMKGNDQKTFSEDLKLKLESELKTL